jgi:hypothetical protein
LSDGDFTWQLPGPPPVSIDQLAREQGVRPVQPDDDMSAQLWDTEEDLRAFLADIHASRQADVG